jgi:L-ribulose-5-phosphate 4-epimerase
MIMEQLKKEVYDANMFLHEQGLAPFTWGNASGIDREKNLIAIKPSGIEYSKLTPEMMVVVDLEGNVVESDLKPSSDTPTHIELYKAFPEIGGCVHTHSVVATSFAQAGMIIRAYGTTHADFCYGSVPCTRALTKDETEDEYEKNTGLVIIEHFKNMGFDPNARPCTLVRSHGTFAWGKNAIKAAENAGTLEIVAQMAMNTVLLNPQVKRMDQFLLDKHYLRKHGKNAYYGQK